MYNTDLYLVRTRALISGPASVSTTVTGGASPPQGGAEAPSGGPPGPPGKCPGRAAGGVCICDTSTNICAKTKQLLANMTVRPGVVAEVGAGNE